MHEFKAFVGSVFSALNYGGYFLWYISVLNLIEQVISDNFNFGSINSFLSFMGALIALVFAVAKLYNYIKDSSVKSKILEQDLIAKERANFPYTWNKEFIEPFKEKQL